MKKMPFDEDLLRSASLDYEECEKMGHSFNAGGACERCGYVIEYYAPRRESIVWIEPKRAGRKARKAE